GHRHVRRHADRRPERGAARGAAGHVRSGRGDSGMKFYCVCRGGDKTVYAGRSVEAENAIEAIRAAALKTGHGGDWTAYREVVTKRVTVERPKPSAARVTFAETAA